MFYILLMLALLNAEKQMLFKPVTTNEIVLTEKQKDLIKRVKDSPDVIGDIKILKPALEINKDLKGPVHLPLPNGEELNINEYVVNIEPEGIMLSWDNKKSAIVNSKSHFYAIILIDKNYYFISPIGENISVIYQIDPTKLPPEN